MNYIQLNGQEISLDLIESFTDDNNIAHIEINLQSQPISEVGVDGCQIDDVIEMTISILKSFNKKYSCIENSMAITKLEEAVLWLKKRTEDRIKRGVEGANQK